MGVVGIHTHDGPDVRGLNASGVEISRYRSYWPWVAASILYNAYRVFAGGLKRPGLR
jgi:hypothetical protein